MTKDEIILVKETRKLEKENIQLKQTQNQKAIECLKEVKNFIINYSELKGQTYNHTLDYLNKKIKELEGEKE